MPTKLFGSTTQKALSVDDFFDYVKEVDDRRNHRSHYAEVSWVYRAVNLRSGAVGRIPYTILEGDEEYDFPIALGQLLRVTEADLCLSGAGYWLKQIGKPDVLQGLQRLNPWTMKVETNVNGVDYFEQRIGKERPKRFDLDKIVYFDHLYNPSDDLGPGVAPASVAGVPADLVLHMNEWASGYFAHGAVPLVVLTTEQQIGPNSRDEIRNFWQRMLKGVSKAWRTVVLQRGLEPKVIQPPVKDLAMPELDHRAKEQIAAAFGIPMGMLEKGAVNRATAENHQLSFYTETIIPEAAMMAEIINDELLDAFGLRLEFDYGSLEVIQQQEAEKANSTAAIMQQINQSAMTGIVSTGEARGLTQHLLGQMGVPTFDELEMDTAPPEAEPEPEEVPPEEKSRPFVHGAAPKEVWQELARWRDSGKSEFKSEILPEWFAGMVKGAIGRVGHEDAFLFLKQEQSRGTIERRIKRKVRRVFRDYQEYAEQMIARGAEPDYTRLRQGLQAVLRPEMETVATQQTLQLAGEVGVQFDPAVVNRDAAEWARDYSNDLGIGLTETSRGVVREALATVVEEPAFDLQDLGSLLEPAFGTARSEMIAVTETTRAYSQATNRYQERLAERDIAMTRVWNTAADDRVCIVCGPMNQKPEQDWPGGMGSGPPAHPRCRCWTTLTQRKLSDLRQGASEAAEERERWLAEQED